MLVRSLIALAVLAVIVPVAAALAAPQWATAVGLDVWNVPALREQLEDADEAARDMAEQSENIHQRIEVKERLIEQLITGRTTLAEVTAQFLTLDQDRPSYMASLRRYHPGTTDEERMAHNVIEYTRPRLANEPPSHQAAVMARLQTELRQFVGDSSSVGHR